MLLECILHGEKDIISLTINKFYVKTECLAICYALFILLIANKFES